MHNISLTRLSCQAGISIHKEFMMNNEYKRINKGTDIINTGLSGSMSDIISAPIPADIPHGDMPGDKIEIGEGHIDKARTIFPVLAEMLKTSSSANPYGRAVIAVCGGSGVGKSEIASIISHMLRKCGIGAYTMSGDNYPHRIPKYNDAERLRVFREGGVKALTESGKASPDAFNTLRSLQEAGADADSKYINEYDWFKPYYEGGKEALKGYLGTPLETDYDEVEQILKAFLDGASSLWLKRMGRDEASLWYDEIDMSDIQVLVLEWTHGNSDCLSSVDIPILLNSTPEETLEHRRSRNRDGALDSPFTMLILGLEQDMLTSQAHKAKIIITKSGEIISYEEFKKIMAGS